MYLSLLHPGFDRRGPWFRVQVSNFSVDILVTTERWNCLDYLRMCLLTWSEYGSCL